LATDSLAIPRQNALPPKPAVASTSHTLFLLLVIIGWSAWGYIGAGRMRASQEPHRVGMYVLTMLMEWTVVAYILWGLKKHGTPLGEVIGGKWSSWKAVLIDIAIAAGFWLIAVVVLIVAALAIHSPRSPEAIRFMIPQSRLEILLWILVAMTAGFCEELIFRGYFQRQFSAWTGNVTAGVVLGAIVFGAGHIYQGPKQALLITIYGLLFGTLAETRRSLRPGMMAHAWHDTFAGLAARVFFNRLS
jgi:uncharacterized protein